MTSYFKDSQLIWTPQSPSLSSIEILRRTINRKHRLDLKDYHDLHKYSVEDYTFWMDLWGVLRIISSVPPREVIAKGTIPEVPVWFPGARLNYAENLLYRNDDGIACTAGGESGKVVDYTFKELREMVRDMAVAMRSNGLVVGDRVAAIITNSITAVVIALATASLGGIFSSTATDMGTEGILDRYRQIKPKLVFADTEVLYAGKTVNLLTKVTDVIRDLGKQGLKRAILLPSTITGKSLKISASSNVSTLSEFLSTGDGKPLSFVQLPFEQSLFILYSSGTSGPPKCIVHSAGGVLMQGKKDLKLNLDLRSNETFFQYTTTGWMMWTYMLTGLSCGARIILYDGSPFHPDLRTYLRFIHDQGVSLLGTSPRFLAEVQGQGIKPSELASFESLRVVACTGAVLTPPVFKWAQQAFNPRIHLVSTSGGTDICAAFVTGAPNLPVYTGEIQCKSLGMKVEVWDSSGNNIEGTGQPGELVCTRPHISLPVSFWGDSADGKKLRETYFSMYPGVWRQGDFILVNPATKGILILGRSDGVLNPSGVRFGSGEIYGVLEKFSSSQTTHIEDAICVGQRRPRDLDERVFLFVKMRQGHQLDDGLKDQIRSAIRKALSARHVPSFIFQVDDIPYTVNGKKIEIAVKQIISGSALKPSGTVANPESLNLYHKYQDVERLVESSGFKARL